MLFDSLFWTLCVYGWLATFIFFGMIYALERIAQPLDKGM
jgi:surface polysaccharide O-acyltransferase-like enzyme